MPRVKGNRLRKAQRVAGGDTTTIGEYEYYGDNRRSQKVVQNCGAEDVANDGGDTTVYFYYAGWGGPSLQGWGTRIGSRWSICETRNGSNQTTFQHLWGTQYTDELIWIEKNGDPTESNDTNPDNTAGGESGEDPADMRYFVHQDRNWNVIALTEYDPNDTNNGRIAERYGYTPYGSFVVLTGDSGGGELARVKLTSTVGIVLGEQARSTDRLRGLREDRTYAFGGRARRAMKVCTAPPWDVMRLCESRGIGLPSLMKCACKPTNEYCWNIYESLLVSLENLAGQKMCLTVLCPGYCASEVTYPQSEVRRWPRSNPNCASGSECCVEIRFINQEGDCECHFMRGEPAKGAGRT